MIYKPVLAGFTGEKALFDVESYPNYILFTFENIQTGIIARFRIDADTGVDQRTALKAYVQRLDVLITYNGHGFDNHVLDAAINGVAIDPKRRKSARRIATCHDIWNFGDSIIKSNSYKSDPLLNYGEQLDGYPLSIDLAGVITLYGDFPKLKLLGVYLGYKHLQELPIPPGTLLSGEQKAEIDTYNIHDMNLTRLVLEYLDRAIEMRRSLSERYHVNLTSHPTGKLGEAIVITAYEQEMNRRIAAAWPDDEEPDTYRMERPKQNEWLCGGLDILSDRHKFRSKDLKELYAKIAQYSFHWTKTVNAAGESTFTTPQFNAKVKLGNKMLSFGMGGLHTEDEPLIAASDGDNMILDIDAAGFYPALFQMMRLAPRHLDPAVFNHVYDGIRLQRLAAKKAGDTVVSGGLKVANNAVFGKQSDQYSKLLDPQNGAAITINGQLILLRLIESLLEIDGLTLLSANTDGVMVRFPRKAETELRGILREIGSVYDVEFEDNEIARVYREHINSYVCSFANGKPPKKKGSFNDGAEDESFKKNLGRRIVKQAAAAFLLDGIPITDTIACCTDLNMFIDYTALNKGWRAEDADGQPLQNFNRWYESTNGRMLYKIDANGKRIKFSNVVSPIIVNDMPNVFPDDIDRTYYVDAAQRLVDAVLNPTKKANKQSKKADKLTDDERDEWEDRQNTNDVDLEWLANLAALNHYRDLYIGKHRFNHYDSMKAVLTALWTHRDFRMSKADLIWCFHSFDSSEGYFQRKDKHKNIMSFIDWLVETIVPVEKNVFPEDDAPVTVTVQVLDREPGAGKTYKALNHIVAGGPRVYWWAISKIDPIAKERFDEIMALANCAGTAIDFIPIHSEAEGKGTMKMRIDKRMQEIKDNPLKDETIFVTLITHKTLIDHFLDGVSGTLLIDEPVQVWEQNRFNFSASHRTVRELFIPQEVDADYDGDLNPEVDADTQTIRLMLTDEGRRQCDDKELRKDSIYGGKHRWIVEQAGKTSGRVFTFAEQWNELGTQDGGELDVIALLHPKHIAHFDQTWMMAAYFKELVIFRMWSELYDVEWVFDTHTDGWSRTIPLNERVNLYYVLENRQVTDTYLRSDPKRRRAMAQAVKDFFGSEEFIWSVGEAHKETGDYAVLPMHVTDKDGIAREAYLTPKANGINCYQNIHGAAWLGTIKLPSSLLSILRRVWKRETQWIALREFELYSVLQMLARGNSRRFDSTDQVRYVVADSVQAAYIADMWELPPDRVNRLPMRDEVMADLDDAAPKKGGKPSSINRKSMSPEDRREYERKMKADRRRKKPI